MVSLVGGLLQSGAGSVGGSFTSLSVQLAYYTIQHTGAACCLCGGVVSLSLQ